MKPRNRGAIADLAPEPDDSSAAFGMIVEKAFKIGPRDYTGIADSLAHFIFVHPQLAR